MRQDQGNLKLFVAKGKGDSGSFFGPDKMSETVLSSGEGAAGWVASDIEDPAFLDAFRAAVEETWSQSQAAIAIVIYSDGQNDLPSGCIKGFHRKHHDEKIVATEADNREVRVLLGLFFCRIQVSRGLRR